MKKDVIIYTLGVLLSRGIALIIVPIYIGYITTEEFGRIDLINQITNFIILISCLEISQGLSRYFYDSNDKDRIIYIKSAFWFSSFIQSIFLTFILFNSHLGINYLCFDFTNSNLTPIALSLGLRFAIREGGSNPIVMVFEVNYCF